MSITYPVEKVVLPNDLKGLSNGQLPAGLLRKIKPYGLLHYRAATAWEAMCQAAKSEAGIELTHVGAYRSFEEQLALFKSRYSPKPTGDPRKITRTYEGKTWHLKKGVAPAGSPGTSNHGWGIAIDCALVVGRKTVPITADPDGKGGLQSGLEWLLVNAKRFGFSWEVASGAQAEAWHIRLVTGDQPTEAVRAYGGNAPVPSDEVTSKDVKKAKKQNKKGKKLKATP